MARMLTKVPHAAPLRADLIRAGNAITLARLRRRGARVLREGDFLTLEAEESNQDDIDEARLAIIGRWILLAVPRVRGGLPWRVLLVLDASARTPGEVAENARGEARP